MIRIRKIRGHKRIWEEIEQWKNNAIKLDLDLLYSNNRKYTKVYVNPFFGFDFLNSITPVPKGKSRSLIIQALFEIYTAWKKELDSLNEPYYLKIWFFPENVGKSQVVCAIQNMIDWYDGTFYQPSKATKKLDHTIFGKATNQANHLKWEYAIEELSIDDEYLGDLEDWASDEDFYSSRRWLKRKMKNPHREIEFGGRIYFNFPQYSVWLGGE